MPARDLDIVSYGATGFVGRQLAVYLDRHAPDGVRLAIAGRDRGKLEAIARTLRRPTEVIVADASDGPALAALASRTRVVASTAGPYARYGDLLVGACAAAGTHWCDITGETPWVATLIERFHEVAVASGARIVPFCGFDSVPSDLGAWLCVRALRERHGQDTV